MVRGIINFILRGWRGRQGLTDILCVSGRGPHKINEITINGDELAWEGIRNKIPNMVRLNDDARIAVEFGSRLSMVHGFVARLLHDCAR